ncbi:MAG: epimerase [Alphaproteobacteria bacterium CG11_big_fil_rev_8_21_14_0_20_39_49]|nr:MAG: epimerase [Alphaproteobacteria bacterium CG11_big_fil_rev_8_21_14_0_20_39_49]
MKATYKKQKRYLVTGGCGFIGSHLVDALINKGYEVVILDNLSTGKIENANPKALLLIGDVTDYNTVNKSLANIDGCFHLAAVASVEKSIKEWSKTHTVNVTATVNIFQAISERGYKMPVVYTSSAAIYGDCKAVPIAETERASPITAYGVDKFSCDLHGRVAWSVHKVPNIGLRPFNVYGARQDPNSPYSGVISIFTDHILNGKIINIFGNGEQIRDFVYIADAVKGFMTAMHNLEHNNHNRGHDEVNLCTGIKTSINQLSEIIAKVSGCKMHRIYKAARQGDIFVSVGDPSYLASRLNIHLTTKLAEGLSSMIQALDTDFQRKAG